MAPELTHSYLLTIIARPERAKRGIDGYLWRRGSCHACEEQQLCSVDVLPGRASANQAARGDGIGRLEGASSQQLWQGAQHSRSACSFRHVPGVHRKTRQQGWSRLLELFHFSEHVFQRLWSERGVFQCVTCDGANTLPKWQREHPRRVSQCWQVTKETPLPRKTRWTKARKCTSPSGSQLIEGD